MLTSILHNADYYSQLRASGYANTGRIEAMQTPPAINSNTGRAGNTSYQKAVNDRIGIGVGKEQRTTGVYVDVLYPQSSRKNPVSRTSGRFEAALSNILENTTSDNPQEENATKTGTVKTAGNTISSQNFVVTVPGGHMEKISRNNQQTKQSRLYDMFNASPDRYTGSLVNVTV